MLIAMGMDANNRIYPVSYGIIELENQYSWTWFLNLGDDLEMFSNSDFTFITDRKKGLLPTIAKLFQLLSIVQPHIGRPPKKRKKSKGEIEMVKGEKLTKKVPTQHVASHIVPSPAMPSQLVPTKPRPFPPGASQTMVNQVVAKKLCQRKLLAKKEVQAFKMSATKSTKS
ncbi:FAR1-related sequence 10 [Tanacetum coccineum]